MYLLDTDWVIQTLAGREPAKGTLERLGGSRVYVSYISVGEIDEGAFASANPHAHLATLRRFLSPYRLLTLDDAIMERFAEIRSFLRPRGQSVADFDLLIAATALRHDLTVLTFNGRHFARIPELRLYPRSQL